MSYFRTICRATVGAVLFYSTLAMPALCDEGSSKDSDWKISVTASQDAHKQWQLDVVMEYHGEKPTELSNDAIPWKWPYAMIVCAVPEPRGAVRPYPPKTVDSDRPMGHLTVKPGETLKGTIPFRSLLDVQEPGWFGRPAIIVFWSYKPQQSDRVGGWIEIPQKNSFWKKKEASRSKERKFQVSVEEVNSKKGVDNKEEAGSKGWKLLSISIENNGTFDVSLGRYELPWCWNKAIIIYAVPINGQRPEPLNIWTTEIMINDPPGTTLKVKPGEVIRGEFAPQSLFQGKELREVFQNEPVIVFWAYRVRSSNWVGGWFEVRGIKEEEK